MSRADEREALLDSVCGYCQGVGYVERIPVKRHGRILLGPSRVRCLVCDGNARGEAYATAAEVMEIAAHAERRIREVQMTLAHRLSQLEGLVDGLAVVVANRDTTSEGVDGLDVGGDHRDTASDRAGCRDRTETEVTVAGDLLQSEETGMWYVILASAPPGLLPLADGDEVEVEVTIRVERRVGGLSGGLSGGLPKNVFEWADLDTE